MKETKKVKKRMITRVSQLTDTVHEIEFEMSDSQYQELIQEGGGRGNMKSIFPEYTPAQISFLNSGITEEEWETHVGIESEYSNLFTDEDIKDIANELFKQAMEEKLSPELLRLAVMFNRPGYIVSTVRMSFQGKETIAWLESYEAYTDAQVASAEQADYLEQ